MSDHGTAALEYAGHGFKVLPLHTANASEQWRCSCRKAGCGSPGKHPRVQRGVHEATTDLTPILQWWRMWPTANVGIATGSGLVVLDIDPRNGGDASLQAIEEEFGELITRTCQTGGGGFHLYFQGDLPTRSGFRPGLDLKAAGGYVVAPPSVHASGKRYAWLDAGEGLLAVPQWLATLVKIGPDTPGAPLNARGAIPKGRRNQTLTSLAGTMRRRGMERHEILAALTEANRRCDPPLPTTEVEGVATSISRYDPGSDLSSDAGAPLDDDRRQIVVREELNAVTNDAIDALTTRPELAIYVRGRTLVTVARDGSQRHQWLSRPPAAPVIVPIELARMLGLLDAGARWIRRTRSGEIRVKRPPEWVAKQVLSRLDWPFPYLEAVIEAPTLRPDGSVLSTPGWDEATGLLYEPAAGDLWPTIPDRPTRADVDEAISALLDPVLDFPFVAASDRAAFAAAILSLVGRHLIDGPVPGFAIRAPTPATGKTLLAEAIGIIGTGRLPATMGMTYQTEELRKRIHALAIDGTPLVLIDNVSGSLGSDVLAGALTASDWKDRILGRSEMVAAPLRAVWIVTGNNLGFQRTLGRRVLPIDLDTGLETPEDRTGFRHTDLRAHVREKRPLLVVSALTILRAFILAGRPPCGGARMGSFEAWDDQIRSAVVWAGLEDPATTAGNRGRGRIRSQADDDLDALRGLLECLSRRFPKEEPFSTAQLIRQAKLDDEFSAVLDAAAAPPKGGHATSSSLGGKLRDHKDRPIGGLVLRRLPRSWKVEEIPR